MIWLRVGLLAAAIGLVVLALTRTGAIATPSAAAPPPEPTRVPVPEPTARPTRVPLPTLGPQMIISRTSQETPAPRPTATPSAIPRVAIVDNGYAPAQMTIPSGTTILWVNTGGDGHDVVGRGPDGLWRSGPLAPGERYERGFWIAGTYDYVCTVHPEMHGQLIVATPTT